MSKTAKTSKRKKAQATRVEEPEEKKVSRREMLLWSKWTAAGVVALGAGGTLLSNAVVVAAAEHNLARVGQGMPSVVQVHDPQCPMCTQPRRATRKAMVQFDESAFVYLIADINKPEGRAFARKYNVPHVTLLLFDAEGEHMQTLQGVKTNNELEPILTQHFEAYGVKS